MRDEGKLYEFFGCLERVIWPNVRTLLVQYHTKSHTLLICMLCEVRTQRSSSHATRSLLRDTTINIRHSRSST